jgi:hypothetical protein
MISYKRSIPLFLVVLHSCPSVRHSNKSSEQRLFTPSKMGAVATLISTRGQSAWTQIVNAEAGNHPRQVQSVDFNNPHRAANLITYSKTRKCVLLKNCNL